MNGVRGFGEVNKGSVEAKPSVLLSVVFFSWTSAGISSFLDFCHFFKLLMASQVLVKWGTVSKYSICGRSGSLSRMFRSAGLVW